MGKGAYKFTRLIARVWYVQIWGTSDARKFCHIFSLFFSSVIFILFFLFSALKFFSLFIWAFPLVVGVFVAAAVSSHIFMLMRPSLFFILVVVFLLFPPHWCFVVFSSPLKKKCELTHSLTCTFNRLKKKGGKTFARTTKNQRRKPKISIKKPRKSCCNFLGTRFFIFLLIILFLCLCGFLCLLWYFVDDCSAIKVYFLPL